MWNQRHKIFFYFFIVTTVIPSQIWAIFLNCSVANYKILKRRFMIKKKNMMQMRLSTGSRRISTVFRTLTTFNKYHPPPSQKNELI